MYLCDDPKMRYMILQFVSLSFTVSSNYSFIESFGGIVVHKATLFFRLHELQTCSWGISKVGRVAQRIDATSHYLYSEFDTSIFSLTVIPIVGWFKLLPGTDLWRMCRDGGQMSIGTRTRTTTTPRTINPTATRSTMINNHTTIGNNNNEYCD